MRTLEQQANNLSQLKNESNMSAKQSNTNIEISDKHAKEVMMII